MGSAYGRSIWRQTVPVPVPEKTRGAAATRAVALVNTAGAELHNVSAYLNTSWELVEREPAIEEQYRDSRQL